MKDWKIGSVVGLAVVAAILIVAGNAWLAVRSIEELNQSQKWVAHTWQVLNEIDLLTGSLKDAESGSRGFLITSDEAYLEPYNQAKQDLPTELAQLQELTSDNPVRGKAGRTTSHHHPETYDHSGTGHSVASRTTD